MHAEPTAIPDVLHIHPDIFPDNRGEFLETYNRESFHAFGISVTFDQDNMSVSKQGVLRGLHFQQGKHAQAKLVSVCYGSVFDVAVDLRPDSPTFGKWVGVTLDATTHSMLWIPAGFAHGFYVLSQEAGFSYKCAGLYNKEASAGIRYDDPDLAIAWPLMGDPILSAADAALPKFKELSA